MITCFGFRITSKISYHLNNYRSCTTPFKFQIMSLVLHGVSKQHKNQCKKFRTGMIRIIKLNNVLL